MTDGTAASRRWAIAPYLVVDDVVATANFYRDMLGFRYDRFWGDPPAFCMVKRNGIVIMLSQIEGAGAMRPNRLADPEGGAWDAYVWVDDADALHAEFRARGVTIAREISSWIVATALTSRSNVPAHTVVSSSARTSCAVIRMRSPAW